VISKKPDTPISCPVCQTPMTLRAKSEKALIYVCQKCGCRHTEVRE